MTNRRKFILGSMAATWPVVARAQKSVPVIGLLISFSLDDLSRPLIAAFREGLRETGYQEGQNVVIEYRSADGRYERLQDLAGELVSARVDVIAAVGGSPAVAAAKRSTTSIPIVFQVGVDPVRDGLVSSLNRPDGNVTGIVNLAVQVGPKRLELLREMLPAANTFVGLINPTRATAEIETKELQAAASTFGIKLHVLHASEERDLDVAFSKLLQFNAEGMVIGGDPFFNSRSVRLAELAVLHKVPAVYQFREFANAGGLASYGSSLADTWRMAGVYTGRILKGAKPADLPIQQSTKAELILNLKTAKALGLNVPLPLLIRADEVIE